LEGVAGGAGKFFGKAINVGKYLASAGGEMLGSGISAAKGAVGGVLETISSMSPVKQITSVISKSAGGVAKVVMSAPVLGAIISGIMSGAEIKGIKDDPELTAAEKKEKIGVKLMEMLDPTSDIIRINGINSNTQIQIFDSVGKNVLSVKGQNSISLSELSDGIYTLIIQDKNETIVKKITLQ
jgi:hypothetical protein